MTGNPYNELVSDLQFPVLPLAFRVVLAEALGEFVASDDRQVVDDTLVAACRLTGLVAWHMELGDGVVTFTGITREGLVRVEGLLDESAFMSQVYPLSRVRRVAELRRGDVFELSIELDADSTRVESSFRWRVDPVVAAAVEESDVSRAESDVSRPSSSVADGASVSQVLPLVVVLSPMVGDQREWSRVRLRAFGTLLRRLTVGGHDSLRGM